MQKPMNKIVCCVLTGGLMLFNMVPVFASNNSQNKPGSQSMTGSQGHKPPPPGGLNQQNGPGMNNPGGQNMNSGQNQQNGSGMNNPGGQDMNSGQNQQNGQGQNMNGGNGQGPVGGNIIDDVADIVGLTADEILEQLKDGNTLEEIAEDQGVTDLLAQLVAVQEAAIDEALTDGKIDDEQAAKMKADLAEQITEMLESTSPEANVQQQSGQQINGQHNNGQQNLKDQGMVGGNILAQVADIVGLTDDEILVLLKDGSTLEEIAQDQGVTDLLTQLVASQEAVIDEALADGKIDDEQAEQMKANLTEQLTRMIESTGEAAQWEQQQGQRNNSQKKGNGQEPIGGRVIAQAADYLGLDESDILDELKDGSSLVDIAEDQGYTEAQLLAQLVTVQTVVINQAVTDGKITSEKAEDLLDNLSVQITKLIEQKGITS